MKKFGLVVIGAHFGVWLNDELSRFDKQNILLVEPVPYNYKKLKEKFIKSSNIHICTNAIFSENTIPIFCWEKAIPVNNNTVNIFLYTLFSLFKKFVQM